MNRPNSLTVVAGLVVLCLLGLAVFVMQRPARVAPSTIESAGLEELSPLALPGVLISAEQASAEQLESYRSAGFASVALALTASEGEQALAETAAATAVRDAELELYYWIEIGRCPELADEHPQWMASLQGHNQWRRLFADAPRAEAGEVVKTYPWTPILYEEVFAAQLARVEQLLTERPSAKGIFLNDLQGAPSACGCGNILCRWTGDYGPIRTATELGDDAAARFVAAVKRLAPDVAVVPVWTTECEEHDGAKDGACAGVGCFHGICWRAYSKQLRPLAGEAPMLGVLLAYRELQRDLPYYEEPAGWVAQALESFQTMPPRRDGQAVDAGRLVAVLQGWDVSGDQVEAQIAQAEKAGAAGYLVARMKIDQSWSPRLLQIEGLE